MVLRVASVIRVGRRITGQFCGFADERNLGYVLPTQKEKSRSAFAMPVVWCLTLLVLFASEEGQMDSFAVLQMGEIWGTTPMEFSGVMFAGLICAIIANLATGWAADRYGRWNVLLFIGLLNTLAGICLIIGQHNIYSVYFVGILIGKALQMTVPNIVFALAGTINNGRDVGPIIGITTLGSGFPQFISPQLMGILRDRTQGYNAGWIFLTLCSLISLLIVCGFKKYYDNQAKSIIQLSFKKC